MSLLLLKPTELVLFTSIKHLCCSHVSTTFPSLTSQSLFSTSMNPESCKQHESCESWFSLPGVKYLITTTRQISAHYLPAAEEEMLISYTVPLSWNTAKPIWFCYPSQLSRIILISMLWSLWPDKLGFHLLPFSFPFPFFFVLTICFVNPWIDNIKVIVSAYRDFITKAEAGKN